MAVFLLAGFWGAYAQGDPTSLEAGSDPITADFLFNYYQQDGNHAAVTGGTGTEELTDLGPTLIVNVPLPNGQSLSATAGVEVYSSASTDRIDRVVSSASSQDVRGYLNLGWTKPYAGGRGSYGLLLGGATEFDYHSFSFGGSWALASENGNSELNLHGVAFFDRITVIYPSELRGRGDFVNDNQRRTFNLSATFAQVINTRMQASLSVEAVLQQGLLSTTFHRVYFQNTFLPGVEQLPDKRLKIPAAIRLNTYLSERAVLRLYYRYYYDDFGITSSTANVEIPFRLTQSLTVSPFYRYYKQTAADYFKPYNMHTGDETFYTSDYDLSAFDSNKYGFGIKYYPLSPIARLERLSLKSLEFRISSYDRSDGLSSYAGSVGLSFAIY
ncbi:MAG: DUF3570 domain-containing protein [Calditrichaeota bacterium]|nr:DUF3570 domain-containing protein [Calditrichota bacterium]